jgi:hypothetical protein
MVSRYNSKYNDSRQFSGMSGNHRAVAIPNSTSYEMLNYGTSTAASSSNHCLNPCTVTKRSSSSRCAFKS